MPNDAKLGLVLGIALVMVIAMVFFRKEPATAQTPHPPSKQQAAKSGPVNFPPPPAPEPAPAKKAPAPVAEKKARPKTPQKSALPVPPPPEPAPAPVPPPKMEDLPGLPPPMID